ncbi:Hypothetical predicted protein [Octopus vulgaris]|uniref:Phospholipase B-like n=1 Tax=Octopus vulgaris TaxID=6645 RepID=A0AA36FNA9_OCTVU|nr:Hypothetical predicted protein [Octopus vulgaris]
MRSRKAVFSLTLLQLVALATVAGTWTAVTSKPSYDYAYVTFEGGDYKTHEGQPGSGDKWVAKGRFNNRINETGWSYLWVETNPKGNNDSMQAFAAGLVEGNLTAPLIRMSGKNSWEGQCQNLSSTYCAKMTKFLIMNLIWMKEMIAEKAKTNPFWHMINLYICQLEALQSVYSSEYGCEGCLPELYWLQFYSELADISKALMLPPEVYYMRKGSCSAMIKVLPGNKDLYVAHDTWNTYSSMLRVLKSYDFSYHTLPTSQVKVPGRKITFSSYPGLLLSMDDYYVISSGMVVMETTIENNNVEIAAKNTVPRGCVLEGLRVMAANRLAANIHQWANEFSSYNSGTYNNMWMVLDYHKFEPNKELPNSDLLLVLEQMPGYIMFQDLTKKLKNDTYWGSYNVPYFSKIVKISGQQDLINKYGDIYTYNNTPRAKIMRRDHVKVKDIKTMIKLMRYNNYKKDPLSRCECDPAENAALAISARSDLNPQNGTYRFKFLGHRAHGAIDMKLTNSTLIKDLSFIAIAGPTCDDVPIFQWSKAGFNDSVPHFGHPDIFKFPPYVFGDDVKPFYRDQ